MANTWVDSTAAGFGQWADGRDDDTADAQGVRLLLELADEELGLRGPEDLDAGALRGLLLEVFPAAVVADADEVPAIVATVRHLIAFLAERGVADGAALTAELGRLEPEFAAAVEAADSTERRAAAEVLTGLMRDDGVDPADPAAAERWLAAFDALPEQERFERTDAYLRQVEQLAVPPVRLAPEAELAAAARASGLTAQARALAAWTGERAVTEYDELTGADAAAAAADLGIATPRAEGDPAEQADLPEIDRLWWAAVEADVIAVTGRRARPGGALADLDGGADADVLHVWLRLFDAAAVPEHAADDGLDAVELVQNELTGVLIHLYEQDAPAPAAELGDALLEHIGDGYEVSDARALEGAVRDALRLEIADLLAWGVVREGAGDGLELTPLGVWGVRELLRADGFAAPLVGELAGASAADLVAGLAWHRADTAGEEIDGWLARHAAKDAAADLLEVMRSGGPGARNLAAGVLGRIGDEAAPVVRAAAGEPLCRPYAALWLTAHGHDGFALSRDEYLWVFVDTLAGMLETAEPDAAVRAALAGVPADADPAAMVSDIWRADHPGTTEVLDALGAHHPDREIAKAARTAAYKARSAQGPAGGS
ncbi:hypothetical protein [Actinomadura parmotrematis]|uniref:HEAT repeat domain-containing protein n=1 Tax=Actinomadura parmotrematis TaxID=2864039 RepID=A0ABS7FKP4_9ACTN|nr:hypothetical protein [Actinomadura parmotrematis]MBW8480928.1 hypothetical protein [Actinomadura parmotrematis]